MGFYKSTTIFIKTVQTLSVDKSVRQSAEINLRPKNMFIIHFQVFKANNISLEFSTFVDYKNHIFKELVEELQSL